MFIELKEINSAAIRAARRGRVVEDYYANIIGTIATKFALNAGAKNLLSATIASLQTKGACGQPKDPKPETLKWHLLTVLRDIESIHPVQTPSRDTSKTHEERQAIAAEIAASFVSKFRDLRATKP